MKKDVSTLLQLPDVILMEVMFDLQQEGRRRIFQIVQQAWSRWYRFSKTFLSFNLLLFVFILGNPFFISYATTLDLPFAMPLTLERVPRTTNHSTMV